MRRKFIYTLWSLLLVILLMAAAGIFAIERGWIGNMPPLDEIQNPISRYASQVYSADGVMMGTWSRNENRIFARYDSIAPSVFQALVATEDVRFYRHAGIDARALARAIVKRGLLRYRSAGGGSTITQQLAKQLYSGQAHSTLERLTQKPVEWVIAVELERHYTKEEILTLYLNYFDFLHNAVGIQTAAGVYFGKKPSELNITEAATLVGMCKNPSFYNPVRNPQRALGRRNIVLDQMLKAGYLTASQHDSLCDAPLALNFHRIDHKEGLAPYMREYLRRIMMAHKPERGDYQTWQSQQYYADSLSWENDPLYGWCQKNTKRDGRHYDIYTDGLKIYTTIDSRMQRYAQQAMTQHVAGRLQPIFNREKAGRPNAPYSASVSTAKANRLLRRAMRQSDRYRAMKADGCTEQEIEQAFHTPQVMTVYTSHGETERTMTPWDSLRYYKQYLRSSLVSIDPLTGYVKAYVGGLNFQYFQYDMAMVGRRQVGSTIKPFVYALAMEDGMGPDYRVPNRPHNYGGWTPRNSSHARQGQMVPLSWGLSQSNNWVTAELMSQIDYDGKRLEKFLHDLGVANNNMQPSMAMCLGTPDITAGEMASAYTAFVAKGIRAEALLVTRIEDSEGNIVAEFTPRLREVISEQSSYDMIKMLRGVIDHGTGRRLRGQYQFKGPIAGKTGTTNDNSDGWFLGCVPRLVTACWVGGEERDIHFNSGANGQGSAAALPIWALYMKRVYADRSLDYDPEEEFPQPPKPKSFRGHAPSDADEADDQAADAEEQVQEYFE